MAGKITEMTAAASLALTDKVEVATDPSGTPVSKAAELSLLQSTLAAGGWLGADAMTYGTADAPTFTMTCSGDKSAKYYAGQRIKLTQSTGGTKYFIVTAVAYTSSTTITLYGGTDYTLNNEAITSPYYSMSKAPAGFPLDPTKWTVVVKDTSLRAQASPSSGTWYNLGSLTISVPIGCWRISYQVGVHTGRGSVGYVSVHVTLSTGNNTESDTELTSATRDIASLGEGGTHMNRWKILSVAAKTSYYLNAKVPYSGYTTVEFVNDTVPGMIRAECVYL